MKSKGQTWQHDSHKRFSGGNENFSLEAVVASAILDMIRAKISSWSSVNFYAHNTSLCDDWLIDSRIFYINNCSKRLFFSCLL